MQPRIASPNASPTPTVRQETLLHEPDWECPQLRKQTMMLGQLPRTGTSALRLARALEVPEDPVAGRWHAATLLREYGRQHNAVLVAHDIPRYRGPRPACLLFEMKAPRGFLHAETSG